MSVPVRLFKNQGAKQVVSVQRMRPLLGFKQAGIRHLLSNYLFEGDENSKESTQCLARGFF